MQIVADNSVEIEVLFLLLLVKPLIKYQQPGGQVRQFRSRLIPIFSFRGWYKVWPVG